MTKVRKKSFKKVGKSQGKRRENVKKKVGKIMKYLHTPKLLVIVFRKYKTSRGLRTHSDGPESLTRWKSESVSVRSTDQPTD